MYTEASFVFAYHGGERYLSLAHAGPCEMGYGVPVSE